MHHVHVLTVMAAETLRESGLVQNTGTCPVLIKRLKKAMCAFAWRNPCDVDVSIRLTEVTQTRGRVTVTDGDGRSTQGFSQE